MAARVTSSFLLSLSSVPRIGVPQFIRLPVEGNLVCFQFGAIKDKASSLCFIKVCPSVTVHFLLLNLKCIVKFQVI